MLAVVYLMAAFLAGLVLVQRLTPTLPTLVRLSGALVVGIVPTVWVTYLFALGLSPLTEDSLRYAVVISVLADASVIVALRRALTLQAFKMHPLEVAFLGLSLLFSFWLMDNRLFYARGEPGDPLLVSSETWGDTALHVALSKSFSAGDNYPTEYPFFGNEPVRYHFGYDFFAGALQKGGMSVGLSFNLPGALGFTAMMVLLFSIGRMLFYPEEGAAEKPWLRRKGVWVGLIAVSILLTNQSLEFLRWFDPSSNTKRAAVHYSFVEALKPSNWWHHQGYLSIGPYYPDKIAIFDTLNVFLTQTHLIIAMALVLFVAFGLLAPLRRGEDLKPWSMALLGVVFGLSFWLNGVLYIAAGVFFGILLVIFATLGAIRHAQGQRPESRSIEFLREFGRWTRMAAWFIVPGLLLAIPQAVWLNGGLGNGGAIQTHIGYLVCSAPDAGCHGIDSKGNPEMDLLNLADWREFVNYWLLNEGLVFPLLIVAIVIGRRSDWKIIAAIMSVFVFGSMFQLSRDLGGHNHKVFNLWEILAAPFVGYVLVEIWNIGRGRLGRLTCPGAVSTVLRPVVVAVVPVAFFFLMFSGLLDFMTIKNDFKVPVFGDKQPAIEWIENNTPGDSMFLVVYDDLYTAPTLAGRRVFLGYRPWAGSAGYDVPKRETLVGQMYGAQSKEQACSLLLTNAVDYVEVGPAEQNNGGKFNLNAGLFSSQFTPAGSVQASGGTIVYYDVTKSCGAVAATAAVP
ncbi:MAG TPA: hypothetical protein VLS25_10405 [Dehalococcoidia bacterium]|nr:hypothetical protein [Dehalococcoidia bacterium]